MATPTLSRSSKAPPAGKIPKGQSSSQVVLERVLGFTSNNNCSLSLDLHSGVISYAAGCVIVLRCFDDDHQQFIQSANKKPITAIEFSSDGKYIATGESGHQPMVRIWSVIDGSQLAEYAGHHFRVIAVRFSPSTRYLVSLGSQEDNTLYVWDRSSGQRIASAKVTNKISGVAFSPGGQFFVTVGVRHVRYWYLETKRSRHKETIPLSGRNAILGDLFNNTFLDVCCTRRTILDVTRSPVSESKLSHDSVESDALVLVVSKAGQLMQFNEQRYLDKWVELKVPQASCLSIHESWVAVGCSSGICLIFDSQSLQFLARLPLPHQLGSEAELLSPAPHLLDPQSVTTGPQLYADFLAIKLDMSRYRAICFYADHSIYVWNIADLSNLHLECAHSYHSRGVWSVDCLSDASQLDLFRHTIATADCSLPPWWTESTFVTCADDGTTRFWDLKDCIKSRDFINGDTDIPQQTKEGLRHVIFTDPTYKYLCVTGLPSAGVGPVGGPPPSFPYSGQGDSTPLSPSSPTMQSVPGSLLHSLKNSANSNGCCIRAVSISPDCRHLALGDRDGNLRIYDLATMERIRQISAHDGEILSLNFFRSDSVPELTLLCSASRDRLIHIFDPNQDYSLVQTIADHSAAIFAARIIETEEDGEIRLVSCGMDKSLLIRVLEPDEAGLTAHFALEHHLVGKHSQLDAAFTPSTASTTSDNKQCARKRYLAVACQDRRLRIYNVATGRQVRCYRGSFNEDGCLLRCAVDPTGSIVATSGSDKQMNLFHLLSGEAIATLFGHSELALCLRFLPDMRHLITVSSDSCVFVWLFSPSLTHQLVDRLQASKRFGSCCGLSVSTTPTSGPVSTVSFRLPPTYRTRQSHSTEEFIKPPQSPSYSASDRTFIGDDDSHADLVGWDIDHLLLRDPSGPTADDRIDNSPRMSSFRRGFHHSNSSEQQPGEAVHSSSQNVQKNKPAFYFSASALPAWARRKLMTTRSEKEGPDKNGRSICSEAGTTSVGSDKRSTGLYDASPVRRVPLSLDQPTRSSPDTSPDARSRQASPCGNLVLSAKENDLISGPVCHYRDSRGKPIQVMDSRRSTSRTARAAVSRDTSPCSVATSAPSTPLRRARFSTEPDINIRSLRHPSSQTSVHCISSKGVAGIMRSQSTRASRCCRSLQDDISTGSHTTILLDSHKKEWPHHSTVVHNENFAPSSPSGGYSSPSLSRKCLNPRCFTPSNSSSDLISTRNTLLSAQCPDPTSEFGSYPTVSETDRPPPNSSEVIQAAVHDLLGQNPREGFPQTIVPCALLPPKSEASSSVELRTISSSAYSGCTLGNTAASSNSSTNTKKIDHSMDSDITYFASHSLLPNQLTDEVTFIHPMKNRQIESELKCETTVSNSNHLDSLVFTRDETPCQLQTKLADSGDPSPPQPSSRARWSPNPYSPDESPSCDEILNCPASASTNLLTRRPIRPCHLTFSRTPSRASEMGTIDGSTVPLKNEAFSAGRITDSARTYYQGERYSSSHQLHTQTTSHYVNLAGPNRFESARDALKSVQVTLDTAIQRCIQFNSTGAKGDELNHLCSLMTKELEWRFTQLRAMLGLEPICVEPPVARVLLADIVERLIPVLRSPVQRTRSESLNMRKREPSTIAESETKTQPEQMSSVEWVVDSTTELPAATGSGEGLSQLDGDIPCFRPALVDHSSQQCDES